MSAVPGVQELLDEMTHLGEGLLVFPIDIFELGNRLAEHPDGLQAKANLVALLDVDNAFARLGAVWMLCELGTPAFNDASVLRIVRCLKEDRSMPVGAAAVRQHATDALQDVRSR